MNVIVYVVNFKNDARKERMTKRFGELGFGLVFVPPVTEEDSRLENVPYKRTSSIMLQHLDSIRHYYENTSYNYCIVCEDDILISKYFGKELPKIIQDFEELNLDSLLLGYLFPGNVRGNWHFPSLKQNDDSREYSYHGYPDDIWGSQMYMISRAQAESVLNTFTVEYAMNHLEKIPYNPDWTITKHGKRAILYPMMAVEEGITASDHQGQNEFHRICFTQNYREDVHI